ncbi:TVP38/TMEM64 family protein [Marinobacter orientalis]|uniref:TVP38/TMEM64 family membrane protein n=1 Tax=Marinobacter orientalis TaxID=1928859 RepID=A0A7Y0RAG3_9GAMM|nr:TVP38/TMEM64 family protein [Marinobacter orientalis]NMT62879.1 TVP38/TMEM64 family protein [Marinobacter orientalis]TGX51554.1 TVP38/TMEM64 family protein [Marinobacter orientalis]
MRVPSSWPFRLGISAAVVLLMLVLWLVLRQMGMPASLSPDALSAWLNGQGVWGPVFLFLMMVLAVVVGPIPTLPVSAAAGLAFGVFTGTLLAAAGALTGAMIAFSVARILGREALRERLSANPVFASDGSQRLLFWMVFLTRLIPLFSFALISYAAGVTAIHGWRFAVASLLGMLPMTFVFAGLGTTFELNPVVTVMAAVVILFVMTMLPWYLSRRPGSRLARWLRLDLKRWRNP